MVYKSAHEVKVLEKEKKGNTSQTLLGCLLIKLGTPEHIP